MKSIKSLTPRSLAQQGVSKGEASPLLRLRHRWRQQRRVDALVAPVHAPVEMRAGDAPGLAEAGHHLVLAPPLARDRERARSGKGAYGRVNPGGRRTSKTNKQNG